MVNADFTYTVNTTETPSFQSMVVGSDGTSDLYRKKFFLDSTVVIVLPFQGDYNPKKSNLKVLPTNINFDLRNKISDNFLTDTVSVNVNSKYEGIVVNVKEMYNDSVKNISEEELSMYKSVYNGILLIEKFGIFLGILFSVFVLALPFYTSINWLLSVGAALPGGAISIFLYNLVRGERE